MTNSGRRGPGLRRRSLGAPAFHRRCRFAIGL